MISIIPFPNYLNDKNNKLLTKGFILKCPEEIFEATSLFKLKYQNFLNKQEYLIEIVKEVKFKDQEYYLNISEEKIEIKASSLMGTFYALTSLEQIIEQKENVLEIKMCEIHDRPHFSHRSFSLDESRHFFGKEQVKKIIDILSFLKFNYFHWHLSDDQGFRINLKKFPKLKEIGSKRLRTKINSEHCDCYDNNVYQYYYEEEDILEIVEYAKQRYISVIPEIDLPGHTASIVASYPFLHCQNKQIEVFDGIAGNKEIICLGKETTYDFLKDFLTEILKLFKDSEYFHLGGDEVIPTNWENCPDCLKMMKENGYANIKDIQGIFTNRIINEVLLKDKNRKIIMWHDGIKEKTNSNVILQYWTWQMEDYAIQRINQGRSTIYSPCCQCYFDSAYAELPLKETYSRGIKLKGLSKKGLSNIYGMECCSWNEFIRDAYHLEFMILPRLHAFSESAWTHKKNRKYRNFLSRLDYHYEYLLKHNYNSASKKIIDHLDQNLEISNIFRNKDGLIEMKMDNKIK